MTPERLLSKLDGIRPAGKRQWSARCPGHEDQRASLSVGEGTDGRVLLTCHAGCAIDAIVKAIGIEVRDLMPQSQGQQTPATTRSPAKSRMVAAYDYTDADGGLLYQVCRYEPKDFSQRRPDGKGGWERRLNGMRRTLYHLPQIIAGDAFDSVFIVEGEKDVATLEGLGLTSTTNAQGAGAWKTVADHAREVLRGRHVVVLPDNDEPGRKHAAEVAASLHGVAAIVKVVDLPGLPPKGDVSDWIAAGGTRAHLEALVEQASNWSPQSSESRSPEAGPRLQVVTLSKVQPTKIEWEWKSRIARGVLTSIFGDMGKGKTLLAVDLGARRTRGVPMPGEVTALPPSGILHVCPEDPLSAVLWQRYQQAGADMDRVHIVTGAVTAEGQEHIPTFPACIPQLEEAWAAHGKPSIVLIDNIDNHVPTGTDTHRNAAVRGFLVPLARFAEHSGCAVILVQHMTKAAARSAALSANGSVAYAGVVREMLLVAPDKTDETVRVVAVAKSNVGPIPRAVRYRIKTDGDVPHLEWIAGEVDIKADDLIEPAESGEDRKAIDEAVEALRTILVGGRVEAQHAIRDARAAVGCSERTVGRARARLGVAIKREGAGKDHRVYWSLPDDSCQEPPPGRSPPRSDESPNGNRHMANRSTPASSLLPSSPGMSETGSETTPGGEEF